VRALSTSRPPPPEPGWSSAVVERVVDVGAVRRILFRADADFSFAAGQWVDLEVCSAPDLPLGGFSPISADAALTAASLGGGSASAAVIAAARAAALPLFELAVRRGRHPTTAHLHSPALAPGRSRVFVRTGGRFHEPLRAALAEPGARPRCLAFFAGGVGAAPLLSMLLSAASSPPGCSVVFCYTARTRADLVFAEELRALARLLGPRRLLLFLSVSREAGDGEALPEQPWSPGEHVNAGRPSRERVLAALALGERACGDSPGGARAPTLAFVCGPPAYTDAVVGFADGAAALHFERWW
jgi:ferredoxin-NADP reductase